MDLNKLKYFMAVAENEHVTRAAQQLSIAQPALTRALHRLEDELGVKLFVREGRNIRLTPEGIHLRDRCAAPLDELARAEQTLRVFSETERATVSICMRSASVVVVDAIAGYSADHPEALFAVTQDDEPGLVDVIVDSRPWQSRSQSEGFVERIGVALPFAATSGVEPEQARADRGGSDREGSFNGHPFHSEAIHLADLCDEGFIALAGSRGMRPQCDRLCEAHGFVPRTVFESDNPSVVRKMICLGLGIGFWPEYSWGPLDEGSVWLPIAEEDFKRVVKVSITPRGMEKTLARDFKQYLEEALVAIWAA